MSALRDYLVEKRAAVQAMRHRTDEHLDIKATVTAEGRSGIRRVKIREHQVISDASRALAGYDLGPTAPELQLGVLGSCLTHTFLIQAALAGIAIDAISVEVTGTVGLRGGQTGPDEPPVVPRDLAYTAAIDSPATPEELDTLRLAVERACPLYLLLTSPVSITGSVTSPAPA